MGKIRYIFFDLDGTLTDPELGITSCVAYALDKFGINVEDRKSLQKFIGPPLADSFREYFGLTEEQAWQGVIYYRERFDDKGWCENKVYPGILELLEHLRQTDVKLMIATSKPEIPAIRIADHFGLIPYLDDIAGSNLDGTRSRKDEVIRHLCEKWKITDPDEVIMIGDRKHDIEGAAKNGIECIGVLYGYGDLEEHQRAGAVSTAETVEELENILFQMIQ